MRIARIRLFGLRVRYVPYRCTMRGGGSGYRSNSCNMRDQVTKPF